MQQAILISTKSKLRLRFGEEEGACGYGAFPALTQTGEAEWSRLLLTTTGCSAAGSARGLGACNTPGARSKSEIPQPLASTGVFALPLPSKSLEHGPLTTCLTTTTKQENRISGCSSDGRARGLGPRGRWFETSHSDQKGGFTAKKPQGAPLCGFIVSNMED